MVYRYCFADLGSIVWIKNYKRLKLDPSISFMICYTPRAESALQRIWESQTNLPPEQSVNLGYQWAISYFRCRLHERKLEIPNSNLFKQIQIISLIPWQIKPFAIFPFAFLLESTRGNSVCLSVCLSVRLSVITFSYFEYSIIWWSRPCNPYIFWKLIMLATSTALFWPSTTKYQPVPPSIDPVFNDLMV